MMSRTYYHLDPYDQKNCEMGVERFEGMRVNMVINTGVLTLKVIKSIFIYIKVNSKYFSILALCGNKYGHPSDRGD